MSDYASNCPISRPVKPPGWVPDNDFGGLMWSHANGLMFNPQDEFLPIRLPAPSNNIKLTNPSPQG
jgi:hypothetical protein